MARTQVWILGGGTLVAGAAVALWLALSAREAPQTGPLSLIPQTPAAAAPTQAPIAANQAEAPEVQPAPAFDVVRISAEGEALVAGSALPGAAITLRVDGARVAEAAADAAGQFVALFSLGYSDTMQMMTLEMADAQGQVVEAPDTVMLTPRPAPVTQVAALAAPEAEAVPVEVAVASDPVTPQPEAGAAGAVPVAEVPQAEAAPVEVAVASDPVRPQPEAGAAGAAPVEQAPPAAVVEVAVAPDPVTSQPFVPASEGAAVAQAMPVAVAEVARAAGAEAAAAVDLAAATTDPGTTAASQPAQPELAQAQPSEPAVDAAPLVRAEGGEPVATAPEAVAANTSPPQAEAAPAVAEPAPEPQTAALAAAAPTAILMRGDGRVEVLDRAPQVMDNVVIDAISYSDTGDVQISGRAAGSDPAGSLRIYLDNRPVALARAESGDWTLDLPAVDAGIYTLRVDQLSPEGGVVSRFETPFLRESPEALAQARARTDSGQVAAAQPADTQPAATQTASVEPAQPEPVQTASLQAASPEPSPQPARPRAALITVQPGHTLWAISRDRYGEGERYMVIFNANRGQIRDPDLIYPGQVFALPEE